MHEMLLEMVLVFARYVRTYATLIDDRFFPPRRNREEFIHATGAHSLALVRFIDILPPFPAESDSIRQFRYGSRGCNIMERYCEGARVRYAWIVGI